MKRDVPATKAKQFLDPRSYVARDGREVLYGKDWKARVEELRLRSGGRCEQLCESGYSIHLGHRAWIHRVERCRAEAVDPDHIVKRSVKRDDRLDNLQALCRFHHKQKHPEFEPQFSGSRKGVEANG